MTGDRPLVSCLMVTRNRATLAHRALHCFAQQTWEHKELVIVDDGSESYEPLLAPYRERWPIHYFRVSPHKTRYLGALRNLALEHAEGAFCVQWDDDDWYHPERISRQMAALETQQLDAVLLRWTLMHVDHDGWRTRPFRTQLRSGTPGTILHRRTDVRYANVARMEDSRFRDALKRGMRVGFMREPHGHLFIRSFHGANTWELEHFTERLHRTPPDRWRYLVARYIRRDVFTHPAFRLNEAERTAVGRYFHESRVLGLMT